MYGSQAEKMRGMLALAQLQHRVAHNFALNTLQCSSLTPFVQLVIIICDHKNIEFCFKFRLSQPLSKVAQTHRCHAISFCCKLLYMYESGNISLPIIPYTHDRYNSSLSKDLPRALSHTSLLHIKHRICHHYRRMQDVKILDTSLIPDEF